MTPLQPAQVWQALEQIPDPEIPVVNIVGMGLIRSVEVEGQQVTVGFTPTFSGCPALHQIRQSIEQAIHQLGGTPQVKTLLSPAWSTDWIDPPTRQQLREFGITPPIPTSQLIQLEASPRPCPRCGSLDTSTKNTFGPTLCKSIHYCHRCQEPFEAFKTL